MEVFISDLPQSAAHLDLVQLLTPYIHSPSFGSAHTNFHIHVFRTKPRFGKPSITHAKLTIPSRSLVQLFLRRHGGRGASGISLRGRLLSFKLSTGSSNPHLVHKLLTTAFVDPSVELERRKALAAFSTPIRLAAIEFGRLCTDDVFSIEYRREVPSGQVTFNGEKRLVVLRTVPDTEAMEVSMRFDTIVRMLVLDDKCSILLLLSQPPAFDLVDRGIRPPSENLFGLDILRAMEGFGLDDRAPLRYRKASFDVESRSIAPYVSTHIRLIFPSPSELDVFRHRRTQARLPKVVNTSITSSHRKLYSPSKIASLKAIMSRLDVRVAFQMHSMLTNGTLDADQLVSISRAVERMERERGPKAVEKVLVMFAKHRTASIREKARGRDGPGTIYGEDEDGPTSFEVEEVDTLVGSARRGEKVDVGTGYPSYSPTELLQQDLKSASEHVSNSSPSFSLDEATVCRQIVLTPSGSQLQGPFLDQSNSILRRYPSHSHQFLRVCIRDEDLQNLRHDTSRDMVAFLLERFRPFFVGGLEMAGRKFELIGWSQSSLKDHSTWFVSPFEYEGRMVDAESVRKDLGNFDNVNTIPARWMARIAQGFTATEPSITLQSKQIISIPDVEFTDPATGTTSCFTDGVGTISRELARDVDRVLASKLSTKNKRRRTRPTCYQVRSGGYKGMLVIDPKLKGRVVCFRPSMRKFDAPNSLTLDIAYSFTRPLPAFLNRPLIKILEDLDVDPEVIMEYQRSAVRGVDRAREGLKAAATLMDHNGLGVSSQLPSTLRTIERVTELDLTKTPGKERFLDTFIESCISLAVTHALRDLKFKARIPLPGCWTLVGVADEDGYLEEGEIYACVKKEGEAAVYIEGEIAISRSPSVHPGDVRVVRAVGRLDSHLASRVSHLVNCVIFSIKGKRSLPSMLGGGDLDGDLYQLITIPGLTPDRLDIVKPGEYRPPTMNRLDRTCTIEDGADFYLNYVLSDLTGPVASRHLHLADKELTGTHSAPCLLLAQLHSDAVDFPKTGTPVNFRSLPQADALRPDFMCPEQQAKRVDVDYYESPKILGRLFRDIPLESIDPSPLPRDQDYKTHSLDSNRNLTKSESPSSPPLPPLHSTTS